MSLLIPKKVKHRKWHRGKSKGVETRGTDINFGSFALKSMGTKWITSRQIEAARRHIIRYMKKGGKLWIRIFPDKPITKKPAETRMGKGKGSPSQWVAVIRPGRILFEVGNVSIEDARKALRLAAAKLPIKSRFVKRVERV